MEIINSHTTFVSNLMKPPAGKFWMISSCALLLVMYDTPSSSVSDMCCHVIGCDLFQMRRGDYPTTLHTRTLFFCRLVARVGDEPTQLGSDAIRDRIDDNSNETTAQQHLEFLREVFPRERCLAESARDV